MPRYHLDSARVWDAGAALGRCNGRTRGDLLVTGFDLRPRGRLRPFTADGTLSR